MARALISLMVAGAMGCASESLHPLSESIAVEPAGIDFGEVVIGVTSKRRVVVRNTSRVLQRLSTRADPGFGAVEPGGFELPAGGSIELEVPFTPSVLGAHSTELHVVRGEQVAARISLAGEGVPVPACESSDPCRTSAFSFETGSCVDAAQPDGTDCSSPCLVGATCVEGVCRGDFVSCEDEDPCTVDACSADGTCLHAPIECSAGAVCQQGRCVLEPLTPEQRCQIATPCQPAGVWRDGLCQRSAMSKLTPAWRYSVPPGTQASALAVDANENLYWAEWTPGTPGARFLVSVDRDGRMRFRVPLDSVRATWLMVRDGTLYLVEQPPNGPDEIVARSAADGSVRWRKDVGAQIGLVDASHGDLGAIGPDRIVFTASEDWNEGPVQVGVYETTTDRVLWTRSFEQGSQLESIDEHGRIFVREPHAIVALSPVGAELWSTFDLRYSFHTPVFSELVFMHDGRLLDARTGTLSVDLAVDGADAAYNMNPRFMVPGAAIILGRERPSGEEWAAWVYPPTHIWTRFLPYGPTVVATPEDGAPLLTTSDVSLTDRGSLIYVHDDGAGGFLLREVRLTGEILYECPLPKVPPPCCGLHMYGDAQVLLKDRWVAAGRMGTDFLIAYDVPGAGPPPRGWNGSIGDGTGHPR